MTEPVATLADTLPPGSPYVGKFGVKSSGAAANMPARTVPASPARRAAPTSVQCLPSAESYPVITSPERVSRSQRGDAADTAPGRPAMSLV